MKETSIEKISVGLSSCGIASGGRQVFNELKDKINSNNLDIKLFETGCAGMCYCEVLVDVYSKNGQVYTYGTVDTANAARIFEEHILNGIPVTELLVRISDEKMPEEAFFNKQVRIVLDKCGEIDPSSIDEYIERSGYTAIKKVLQEMKPLEVIEVVKKSGLRGRGGAGFSTGMKWTFANNSKGDEKFIICNADEGDPGAFMDRSILEGDPHAVIEGMIIAGFAIGASTGYIYARAEYPIAVARLKTAISKAREKGYLGENILDSNFSFDIKIREGAGAFVCGEETALIASIEGRRGMPKLRPPFPAVSGLWKKPTNINNVETFANVPWIILNGADKFAAMGTEKSKGTKVFALAGKINRGGLIEVPMGITLREVIFDVGGGIKNNKAFKAVQMGGPSGGCIPASLLDTPVDYENVQATGAIMGSGGMIVLDETTCMVDVTKFFLNFTQEESCGKCTYCRLGTKRMLEILERICAGEGKIDDLELLDELSHKVRASSLCGLGQTAPNPVLTTLKYFRDEYLAHINDKKCPAKVCKALIHYEIIADKCTGCTACVRVCPVGAISGEIKKPHMIDISKCVKCGVCRSSCKFEAIEAVS